jgi:hypothetical protein
MYNITVRSGKKILSSHVSHEHPTSLEEEALVLISGDPNAFVDICRLEDDIEIEQVHQDSI